MSPVRSRSPAPILTATLRLAVLLSSFLHLHDETGDGLIAFEQHLMRRAGGHMCDITWPQILERSTSDGLAARLSGSDDARAINSAARDQCGCSGKHNEQICKAFVHFHLSAATAEGE